MSSEVANTRTALLLVDVQQGFNHPSHWGSSRSTPTFETNVEKLLKAFRTAKPREGAPPLIIHVYHSSLIPDNPLHPSSGDGIKFTSYATPRDGELIISKHVNSAFIGTDLEGVLKTHGIRQLVICGLTTDHCVSTSTRMAANLGVTDVLAGDGSIEKGRVIVVQDGTATFNRDSFDAETVHFVSLASLKDEFAEVMTTDEVLAALL